MLPGRLWGLLWAASCVLTPQGGQAGRGSEEHGRTTSQRNNAEERLSLVQLACGPDGMQDKIFQERAAIRRNELRQKGLWLL